MFVVPAQLRHSDGEAFAKQRRTSFAPPLASDLESDSGDESTVLSAPEMAERLTESELRELREEYMSSSTSTTTQQSESDLDSSSLPTAGSGTTYSADLENEDVRCGGEVGDSCGCDQEMRLIHPVPRTWDAGSSNKMILVCQGCHTTAAVCVCAIRRRDGPGE